MLQAGKVDDLVEALGDLLLAQTENRAIEEDVLAPGQLWVKAGAELEEGRDLPPGLDPSFLRTQDAGHALQQRALAGAVLADEGERRALRDLQRHVPERPEFLVADACSPHDRRFQRLVALVVQPVLLRDVVDRDDRAHTSSASRRSRRRNTINPTTSKATAHTLK
jgi:hypothetical protein